MEAVDRLNELHVESDGACLEDDEEWPCLVHQAVLEYQVAYKAVVDHVAWIRQELKPFSNADGQHIQRLKRARCAACGKKWPCSAESIRVTLREPIPEPEEAQYPGEPID